MVAEEGFEPSIRLSDKYGESGRSIILRYYQIIKEGYKEAEREFSAEADPAQVKDMIQKFRSLVAKNQVQGNERNIDWWRKQGWQQFSNFIIDRSAQPTTRQIKQGKVQTEGDVIVLREDDAWRIVIPLTKKASMREGRGSDWCTAKASSPAFLEYFFDNEEILIYCIKKNPNGQINFKSDMWAIRVRSDWGEVYDKQDSEISDDEFESVTPFNIAEIIHTALEHDHEITQARNNYINQLRTDSRTQLEVLNSSHDPYDTEQLEFLLSLDAELSDEVQVAAVKKLVNAVVKMVRSGVKLGILAQIAAVQKDPMTLRYLSAQGYKLSKEVIDAAVEKDPEVLKKSQLDHVQK